MELPDVRRRLEADRDEAVLRLARLQGDYASVVQASRDSNADDEHDPEGATIAFERSQLGAIASQVEGQVTEIDAALARLAAGTYGRCERCGSPVAPERLEAWPTARTCIRCAGGRVRR